MSGFLPQPPGHSSEPPGRALEPRHGCCPPDPVGCLNTSCWPHTEPAAWSPRREKVSSYFQGTQTRSRIPQFSISFKTFESFYLMENPLFSNPHPFKLNVPPGSFATKCRLKETSVPEARRRFSNQIQNFPSPMCRESVCPSCQGKA